jgi:cation transport regulator
MPYDSNEDLPEGVRRYLPWHAQDIYRVAFNSAWDRYDHDDTRAHRIAWAAVKRAYRKASSGRWVRSSRAATAPYRATH